MQSAGHQNSYQWNLFDLERKTKRKGFFISENKMYEKQVLKKSKQNLKKKKIWINKK